MTSRNQLILLGYFVLLRHAPVMEVTKKSGTLSGAYVPSGREKCTASPSVDYRNKDIPRMFVYRCQMLPAKPKTFQLRVRIALNDYVRNYKKWLEIRAEASIFSNKPDILVVAFAGFLGQPLLAVEVKQPWDSNSQ